MSRPGLIILAAGGSRRMGRPKQLLPWQGRTLLRHACETALATPCRPVIVVLGREADACARELESLDVVAVINPDWAKGMGTSVATGVAALEEHSPDATGALLMLVDQPSVTPALLEELLKHWNPPRFSIAATSYRDGGGVPAMFARNLFAELRALSGDRGARGLIEREKDRVARVDPAQPLIDLDTPEIYWQENGDETVPN